MIIRNLDPDNPSPLPQTRADLRGIEIYLQWDIFFLFRYIK